MKKTKYSPSHASLLQHTIVISLSLSAGVIIFIFINSFILPKTLLLPPTTAINWLTLHKHAMTLDYIRFGLFIFIIPTSVITGWIIFIWRKNP